MKKLFILLFLITTSLLANIGTIMATKGDAMVKRSNGDVYAKIGLELLEGDTIETQAKSRVQVMLLDETVVTVGAKSSFSFEEYLFDGKNSKVAMTASRGFFRSVTGRIGKLAPQRFKVKTASATIGIRGTDFWGITGGETERVTCNKGAIVIEYNGQTIEVGAGSYASYGPKGVKQGKTDSASKDANKKQAKKQQKKDKQNKNKAKQEENSDENSDDSSSSDESQDKQSDGSSSTQGRAPSSTLAPILPDKDIGIGDIPTEDIADVTQAVKMTEPFSLTPGAEDRPVEY